MNDSDYGIHYYKNYYKKARMLEINGEYFMILANIWLAIGFATHEFTIIYVGLFWLLITAIMLLRKIQ